MHPTRAAACAALILATGAAQAGEVYLGLGLPGVMLGYAQPINDSLTVRGDFATLGSRSKRQTEEGIDYDGKVKLSRFGVFADWFVLGGLRLTGGVTVNDFKLDLVANGNGQNITIGGRSYTTTTGDRLAVGVKFPSTTPYLGIGYGHQLSTGLGFVFDIGASIGTAKLSTEVSGPNLSQVSQADIDAETAELRDGVARLRALPQISFGVAYRF